MFDPKTYRHHVTDAEAAICTLGVGEPSKVSREDFIKIDKTAVLQFAESCKDAGVAHFQLRSSVCVSADSRSFFLRTERELQDRHRTQHD